MTGYGFAVLAMLLLFVGFCCWSPRRHEPRWITTGKGGALNFWRCQDCTQPVRMSPRGPYCDCTHELVPQWHIEEEVRP
jgi:hypothetical protein